MGRGPGRGVEEPVVTLLGVGRLGLRILALMVKDD